MSNLRVSAKDEIRLYLSKSRSGCGQSSHKPPSEKELLDLIAYLQDKGLDPIIVGSVAIVKHLKLSSSTDHKNQFRITQDIDLYVNTSLPDLPRGWRRDIQSLGIISWISPSGGYVDFLEYGHKFPGSGQISVHVQKDTDSESVGLPLADLSSIFRLKLQSDRERDFADLLLLARKLGIPKDVERETKDGEALEKLAFIKKWLRFQEK